MALHNVNLTLAGVDRALTIVIRDLRFAERKQAQEPYCQAL